jgi:hypothetical protein
MSDSEQPSAKRPKTSVPNPDEEDATSKFFGGFRISQSGQKKAEWDQLIAAFAKTRSTNKYRRPYVEFYKIRMKAFESIDPDKLISHPERVQMINTVWCKLMLSMESGIAEASESTGLAHSSEA